MSKQLLFTVIVFNSLVLFVPLAMLVLYLRPRSWNYLFALFLGLLIGWINLSMDEVQLPALLLIAFGMFLGFAQPKGAWRWAIILAMWIPIGAFVAQVTGLQNVATTNLIASFISFAFALAGVYGGAFVNRVSTRMTTESLG